MLPKDDADDAASSPQALAKRALALIAELRGLERELKAFLASTSAGRLHLETGGEDGDSCGTRGPISAVGYKGPMRWARG